LITAHDNPGIRAADEEAAIVVTSSPQLRFQCLPPPVLKMAFADSSLYDLEQPVWNEK
jgi:hypothetical protein